MWVYDISVKRHYKKGIEYHSCKSFHRRFYQQTNKQTIRAKSTTVALKHFPANEIMIQNMSQLFVNSRGERLLRGIGI